jgi:phage repressor protein C with HTH and peptisase S24 domain
VGAGDAQLASRFGDDRNAFFLPVTCVSCNDHRNGFNPFIIVAQQQNELITQNFCRALRDARKKRGESQAEFARFLGIQAQQTYQRYETGQTIPDGLTLHEIATRIGVTVDYLLTGKESALMLRAQPTVLAEEPGTYGAPKFRLVPVLSWARAGHLGEYEELPAEWAEKYATSCPDPKAFAVRLEGDSMEPLYKEGDVVVLMPSFRPYSESLVVAKLKSGDVMFKLMSFLDGSGERMRLTSYNQNVPPRDVTVEDLDRIWPVYGFTRIVWNHQRWQAESIERLENLHEGQPEHI